MNRKADIIVRTPSGNTQSFEICNLVKQGTALGPILNNCSLDDICSEGHGHNVGTVEIKTMEFVDDVADPNNGYFEALKSNQTISSIQKRKRLTFSAEKCKILKINSTDNSNSLFLTGIKLEADPQFRYLGDIINNKGTILHCVKTWPKRRQAPAMKLFHYAKSPFWETLKFLI